MAQNYNSRPITQVQIRSNTSQKLEAVSALDLVELQAHLKVASSDELQALRAHIGLGVAGTKEMNKTLILEHVEQQRSVSVGSPEVRDGRERPVRPGAAAAKHRQVSTKEATKFVRISNSELEDDSFADLPMGPELPNLKRSSDRQHLRSTLRRSNRPARQFLLLYLCGNLFAMEHMVEINLHIC